MPPATDFPAENTISAPAGRALPVPLPASRFPLPDDPAALKTLLQAQQAAMAAWHDEAEQQLQSLAEQVERRLTAQIEQRVTAQIEQRVTAEVEQRLQAAYEQRIQQLYEQLRLARRRLFGPSSESYAGQGWLFDEADVQAAGSGDADAHVELPVPPSVTPDTPARQAPAAAGRAAARRRAARGPRSRAHLCLRHADGRDR